MPEDPTKQQVETELEEIEAMFVQTAAEAAVADGVLTLHDASRSTLYFSDRPKRVVGHVTSEMFIDMWDEGENSFAENPPNAVLAFLEAGDDVPEDVVTVIRNPRMEGNTLSYDIEVLEGTMPAHAKGGVTLFIDPFGRPLSPVSAAGMNRRRRRRMR
jgi:hypothetical protein